MPSSQEERAESGEARTRGPWLFSLDVARGSARERVWLIECVIDQSRRRVLMGRTPEDGSGAMTEVRRLRPSGQRSRRGGGGAFWQGRLMSWKRTRLAPATHTIGSSSTRACRMTDYTRSLNRLKDSASRKRGRTAKKRRAGDEREKLRARKEDPVSSAVRRLVVLRAESTTETARSV